MATDPYCTALYGFTNVSDLVDISPDQVVTYMGSNGYIDDNGDPINSYAEYVATCFTGSTDKIISSLTDANNLDEKCYKEDVALSQNISKEMYTMFHLYQIDKNVVVQMDSPYDPTQETIDSNESSPTQDNYALPVDQKFFDDHETNEPNPELKWFSKPHHDYPAADIPVPLGTNVYAITSGKITAAPNEGGYGRGVTILGDDGVVYNYGHGSDGGSVPGAGNGDVVKAGQLIMHSANTGHSFGAHLHVDMRYNGNKLCPQSLFLALGNKTTIPNTVRLPTSGCSY